MLEPTDPFHPSRGPADPCPAATTVQAPGPLTAPAPAETGGQQAALQLFNDTVQRMRLDYCAALPERLARAREALRQCQAAPDDSERLRELQRQMHTLAGSAGTFGLKGVGDRAGTIEHLLESLLSRPTRTAADLEAIVAMVDGWIAP